MKILYYLADSHKAWVVSAIAQQEPTILIRGFINAAARQSLEGLVGVDKNVLIAILLCHNDAMLGCLDHQFQQFCIDHVQSPCDFHGSLHQPFRSDF